MLRSALALAYFLKSEKIAIFGFIIVILFHFQLIYCIILTILILPITFFIRYQWFFCIIVTTLFAITRTMLVKKPDFVRYHWYRCIIRTIPLVHLKWRPSSQVPRRTQERTGASLSIRSYRVLDPPIRQISSNWMRCRNAAKTAQPIRAYARWALIVATRSLGVFCAMMSVTAASSMKMRIRACSISTCPPSRIMPRLITSSALTSSPIPPIG